MTQTSFTHSSGGVSGSLSDNVYEYVYRNITDGEWALGARLPTETRIAEVCGVSRSVVREAFVRLRVDGIITSNRGVGSFVSSQPSKTVLTYAKPGSVADIQRCFEFRVGIEGEAAYLAAQHGSEERIADIKSSLDAMWRCIENDGKDAQDADIRFHIAVARATENEYYFTTVESVSQPILICINIANALSALPPGERLKMVFQEHLAIYEAIAAHQPEVAREKMRAHIEGSRRRLFVGGDA
jgi:GntR family transcriptional repressor for pyruvate dehydrogenase complex